MKQTMPHLFLGRIVRISYFVFVFYLIYVACGYQVMKSLPSTILVDYSLYPNDLPAVWRLLPCRSSLAQTVLHAKLPEEIQADFRRFGFTLYSGALGYRDVSAPAKALDQRPGYESKFLRDMTSFFYQSGVGLGLDWIDGAGCTAIHEALIDGDDGAARFLLTLGPLDTRIENRNASNRLCQLDLETLARQKGLSIR